jgi:hypothetical protein
MKMCAPNKTIVPNYKCGWPIGERCNIRRIGDQYNEGHVGQHCVMRVDGTELWVKVNNRLAYCQHYSSGISPNLVATVWGIVNFIPHHMVLLDHHFLMNPSLHFDEMRNTWIVFQGYQTIREFIRWISIDESQKGISLYQVFNHPLFHINDLTTLIQQYTLFI